MLSVDGSETPPVLVVWTSGLTVVMASFTPALIVVVASEEFNSFVLDIVEVDVG